MDEFHANVRAVSVLHRVLARLGVQIITQVYDAVRRIPAGKVTTYGTYFT